MEGKVSRIIASLYEELIALKDRTPAPLQPFVYPFILVAIAIGTFIRFVERAS